MPISDQPPEFVANAMVRAFPDGALIMFDHDLRYLNAGGQGMAVMGLSSPILIGHTIFEVHAPEVTDVLEPLYRSALAGAESDLDVTIGDRVYRQRLAPVRDGLGVIVAGTGVLQDVTTTRRRERDVHESEELFRLTFKHAPFAMALIRLDGGYEQVNPAMCALTGYTETQLIGLSIADITHPDDVADDLAAVKALVTEERDSVVLDKRYVTPTGDCIWATKSATLMRRRDGTPQYIISQLKDISAVKEAERVWLEEHRRLRRAESIGRLGSWELDVATEVVTWSPGLSTIMGCKPTTSTDDLAASMTNIHPDDVEAARAALRTCARTGEPQRMRYRITRVRDGAPRWMDARSEAVYEDGRVVRIEGVVADVTEQVGAEHASVSARSLQQAIMTASPDIIYVWDLGSRTTVWKNRSLGDELGYTAAQAQEIDRDAAGVLVPADAKAAYDASMIAARDALTDDAAQLDLPLLHADGSRRWYSRRIAPLHRDEAGAVTQVVGVLRDTTAPMAVQDALRESEAKFRQLAENIDVGFTLRTWEPDEFLYISPGYLKIFGYDLTAVTESPAQSLLRLHPEDRARFMSDYWAVCRAGKPVVLEYRIVRPDGEIRWVRASNSPVNAGEGEPRRSAAIITDITESREAAGALAAAQKAESASVAKNEFLGRMSHELRTPMNAILGFAQLLELDAVPGPQLDAVEHILSGGRHLVSLIDDVLDIAGIEGLRQEMDVRTVSISELLLETTALMSPLAAAARVELVYRPAGDIEHRVRADARRLRQVLQNLLSNAIKYNRPNGRVEIRCELAAADPDPDRPGAEPSRQLNVVVSDTGVGIREADLPRLFTPFDRLDAQTRGIEGTGVGLALSLRLMTTMGGSLRATSLFGVGSSFTAGLELDVPQPSPAASTPSSAAPRPATPVTGLGAKTLLYIEDVSSNVELMESVIRRRPRWQMVAAGHGRLGRELAGTAKPDLILLDIDLPDMTGLDVLAYLRADPITSALPVVIVSADADPHRIERLAQAGADGYLSKPISVGDILRLLDTHDPSVSTLEPDLTA